jgi:DNA repair exonuclease SbcCD nuclease subunit
MKAVVTADNHLNKYYSKMRPNQLEERRKQLVGQFGKVVDYAIENDADLFLNCGDLFDMPNPRNPPVSYVGRKLVELERHGIDTFLVVGNHDKPKMTTGAGGSSPQQIFDAFEVSQVYRDANQIESQVLKINGYEIAVSGFSHNPLIEDGADPLEGKEIDIDVDLSMLLAHYGVEGHLANRTSEPVISHASVDSIGADVVCTGHIHKPTDFSIGSTGVVVPGATERMEFGEIDRDTGFYVLTWDGESVNTEYVELDSQPMHEEVVSANDLGDSPTEMVLELVNQISDQNQLFKLRFEGTLTREEYHRLNVHEIWERGRNANFYFDLVDDIEFEVEYLAEVGGERLSQVEELKRVADQIKQSSEDESVVNEAREMVLSDYGGEQ